MTLALGSLAKTLLRKCAHRVQDAPLISDTADTFSTTELNRERRSSLSKAIGEGEYHYILECSAFQTERAAFIDARYLRTPNTLRMKSLFQSKDALTCSNCWCIPKGPGQYPIWRPAS